MGDCANAIADVFLCIKSLAYIIMLDLRDICSF